VYWIHELQGELACIISAGLIYCEHLPASKYHLYISWAR
jgi:hypothetical protein